MSSSSSTNLSLAQRAALHAQHLENQARQALEEQNSHMSSPSDVPTPGSAQQNQLGPSFDANLMLDPFALNAALFPQLPPSTLIHTGERLLKRFKLDEEHQAEFRDYCQTPSAEERDALLMLNILEVKALLNKTLNVKTEEWKPSPQLTKHIKLYVHAIILLPNLRYYSGTIVSAVLATMRFMKFKELPSEDETVQCQGLNVFIGRQVSLFLSDIKALIKSTVDNDDTAGASIRNIASLADSILTKAGKSCPIEATAGLYLRIAYIRTHLRDFDHSNTDFWANVDNGLDELRQGGSSQFAIALELNYDDDVQKYGDPAETEYKTGSGVDTKSPKWLQHLAPLAGQVQRGTKASKRATKRKRIALENDEEENQEGDE
ncbi:hypothetical protein BDZ89DRAFT_1078389 [Hymenopellis radicata]|nr:hypothetical protein BDZ89DRAFT_1078389 [Hymenopellis radicata]